MEQLLEPHGVDPVNAIIIPVIVALAVGIPLAVYTGVISSRLQTFKEIRIAALTEFVAIDPKLIASANKFEFSTTLSMLWKAQEVAFIAERHFAAAESLNKLGDSYRKSYRKGVYSRFTKDELNDLDRVSRDRWATQIVEFAYEDSSRQQHVRETIENMKPDYGVIFEIPSLARWLRRSDCCETCKSHQRPV